MAEAWVKNGGKVYIAGRREEVLKQAVAKLNAISKDSAFFVVADVSTRSGIDNLAQDISSREESLDVLVNNAGVNKYDSLEAGAILPNHDRDDWSALFSLNAWSPAAVTSALAPLLVQAAKKGEGRGSVIIISSIADQMWFAESPMGGYSLSKVAAGALTKILATKLVVHGVRVNTISPGSFPTEMNDPSIAGCPAVDADKNVPMKRNGSADDIAGAFMYLATQASAYVTGQKFSVDGGWTLVANGQT